MAEYITKDQAISVVAASTDYDEEWLVEDIKELPPADVVEVVRCKDCAGKKACDLWGVLS